MLFRLKYRMRLNLLGGLKFWSVETAFSVIIIDQMLPLVSK
jgi:hypothetical protein